MTTQLGEERERGQNRWAYPVLKYPKSGERKMNRERTLSFNNIITFWGDVFLLFPTQLVAGSRFPLVGMM